jgi:CRISPR-associated endonuclease/helicase Cas3
MSLDLSADLLVTHLAPIPALIQRLGRLNRRAKPDGTTGTRPFLVYDPPGWPGRAPLPYTSRELEEALAWLDALGEDGIRQSDLIGRWPERPPEASPPAEGGHVWLDGGLVTEPWPLREASPGIDVILEDDRPGVEAGRDRPEDVRIPMPPVPRGLNWRKWPVCGFCRVPPSGMISYDPRKGARWTPN